MKIKKRRGIRSTKIGKEESLLLLLLLLEVWQFLISLSNQESLKKKQLHLVETKALH